MKFPLILGSILAIALNVSSPPRYSIAAEPVFPVASSPTVDALDAYSRMITVKISSADSAGSGVIIQQQGQVYTVLTNAHVLRALPYTVHTIDGQLYQASRYSKVNFHGYDLALLQFTSPTPYITARLGRAKPLTIGERVYASGFPADSQMADETGYRFSVGLVSILLEQELAEGYQLGYTSEIHPGMSGGPVLNQNGEVIAINGLQSAPLWGEPRKYQDGSQPCPAMLQMIENSNWAIPIDTVDQLIRQELKTPSQIEKVFPTVNLIDRPTPVDLVELNANSQLSQQEIPFQLLQRQFDADIAKRCL